MITPLVARLVRDPFDREDWLLEPEWDSFRTIADTDGTDGMKLPVGPRNWGHASSAPSCLVNASTNVIANARPIPDLFISCDVSSRLH